MSLKKKTVHSIFWSSLQQFGRQGFSFVFSILLARLLLPAEFGYIAMIMVFINLSHALIDAGLTQSLIREEDDRKEAFSTIFFFNVGMGLLLYVILYLGAPYISGFYDQPILHNLIRWQALILIVHALTSVQRTHLVKKLDFQSQLMASIPAIIIAGCLSLYMAFKGFGVYALVAYYVIDALIQSILLWWLSDWKPQWQFSFNRLKYHFRFGSHLTLAGMLETGFNEIYNVILGKYFSPAHLGYFNRAYTMQRMPVSNLYSILNKVTYPIFAKIKTNNLKLKEVYAKLLLLVVFSLTPVLLFAGVLGEPLFRLVLTEKWLPAVPYFKILCLAGILYPLSSYNINLLKVKGKSEIILRIQLYKKIIFVLSLILIVFWGMNGLLYGLLLNSLIAFLINSYYSGKLIDFSTWDQIKLIMPLFIINFISTTFVYLFSKNLLHLPDALQLVMGMSLGFIVYMVLVAVFEKRILKIIQEILAAR